MIKHKIFGDCEFNVELKKEDNCSHCIHNMVCGRKMEELCRNYQFGTSEYSDCAGCIHRFTRWNNESIPCFKCRYFKEGK